MQKRLLVTLLCLYLMIVTGCVSIPHEHFSKAIEIQELSDHVHFLAQPALKGRKPKTWESATVRRYLKDRFEAYGLVAWLSGQGYEQPFGFGTNVIGILPGSDQNLADEIVILAAHYDHLGKTKKGVLLGACDNASGVAVLLEIAEQLALYKKRPKRTICFASFDCEERCTLGSFVFTSQEDFEKQKIIAMVNIDLLGRDFLDVVDDSLFVVGTELYPKLRARILQAGAEAGVKILPIGTDLVGPRGDHAAFETMGIPVLFFTCGVYKDYHKPTDTADKLNYQTMQNSAALIAETVNVLANAEQIERPVQQVHGDKEELKTLIFLLETINSKYEKAGLSAEKAENLVKLAEETQRLLDDGMYTKKQRQRFVRKAIKALLPVLSVADATFAKEGEELLLMNELYTEHRDVLNEKFRNLVRHLVQNKPGLFGKTKFKYEAYDLGDDEISFTKRDNGRYELHILLTKVHINFEMGGWIFKHEHLSLGFGSQLQSCVGTKEEITDFCLLHWRQELEDESYVKTCQRILREVTGQGAGENYNNWLEWRMKRDNLANEKEWVLQLLKSGNPDLAGAAAAQVYTITGGKDSAIFEVIRNTSVRADVRGRAISSIAKGVSREGLLTLADVLQDENLCWRNDYLYFLDDSYPFSDQPTVSFARKWYEEKGKTITVGSKAEKKLRELTKKDFGRDTEAWRKWIKANVKK